VLFVRGAHLRDQARPLAAPEQVREMVTEVAVITGEQLIGAMTV
jgi:hypothetical protein